MKFLSFVLTAALIFSLAAIGCDDDDSSPNQPEPDTTLDRKPNIYIYPSEDMQLQVKLIFPQGGKVTEAIPDYKDGWDVSVTKEGKINGAYSYLYYENEMPDLTQKEYGWIVKKEDLKAFFENNLAESGFYGREVKDFTDYWMPLLVNSAYYEIYPQYISDLEKMSAIEFTPKPDNIYRLSYAIEEADNGGKRLKSPVIQKAVREGYYAVVWGVIMK